MAESMPTEINMPTEASFNFPEDGKVQPEGLDTVAVNTQVQVTLTGKVKRVAKEQYGDEPATWNFGLDIESFSVTAVKKSKAEDLFPAIKGE